MNRGSFRESVSLESTTLVLKVVRPQVSPHMPSEVLVENFHVGEYDIPLPVATTREEKTTHTRAVGGIEMEMLQYQRVCVSLANLERG